MFSNQYLAFDNLSTGLSKILEQLRAINTSTNPALSKTRKHQLDETGKKTQDLTSEQPVVRIHPDTGRKALYVNEEHTAHFKRWSQSESQPLLRYLFNHQTKPEFTCRFRWQPGSIAIWDNCCTQHLPINDYHGYLREMHRVTVAHSGETAH